MFYIGLMSGTSMDAIDTALVDFEPGTPRLIEYEQYPLTDEVRIPVRQLNAFSDPEDIGKYDLLLADIFADSVNRIISQAAVDKSEIKAIGSHGQTILHLPDDTPPRTRQIGDGARIASLTGIPTITDFRRMDMEAGGQGAPLAPALHADQFRSGQTNRCILNLGGIANITVLPADNQVEVTGFDTGPGNGLMDDWNYLHNQTSMDKDGYWAISGTVDGDLLKLMLADPYFTRPAPKSSGRDYFNLDWLNRKLSSLGREVKPRDTQATLLRLSITSIANAILSTTTEIDEVFMCGGGSHNPALVSGLEDSLGEIRLASTQAIGMNPDAVEAVTFAWLAKRRLEGLPGNLPSVTGAKKEVLLGTIHEPVKS